MFERKIKIKNYIYLGAILLVSIFVIFYFYLWYVTYRNNKLNTPIMNEYLQVINYNELNNYIVENKDAIVYVSVLENEDIREFEDKFSNFIVSKSLKNKILYLDLTKEIKNNDIYNKLISKYTLRKKSIVDIPCLISFKDGNLSNIYVINEKNIDMTEIKFFLKQEGLFE